MSEALNAGTEGRHSEEAFGETGDPAGHVLVLAASPEQEFGYFGGFGGQCAS